MGKRKGAQNGYDHKIKGENSIREVAQVARHQKNRKTPKTFPSNKTIDTKPKQCSNDGWRALCVSVIIIYVYSLIVCLFVCNVICKSKCNEKGWIEKGIIDSS